MENFSFILNLRDAITGSFSKNFLNLSSFYVLDFGIETLKVSTIDQIGATFLSTFLIIIFIFAISYAQSILLVSQTLSFLIFKKVSDDDDIIKRLNETENELENSENDTLTFLKTDNDI